MIWSLFPYFAIAALLLWWAGALMYWRRCASAQWFTIAGTLVFGAYIIYIWCALGRPPMRTIGETRLWYSFFMPVVALIISRRWHYRWVFTFSSIMSTVFVCVNLFKPEVHGKALMPALQSAWFAPHVIVYMFSYALLGAAAVLAAWLLVQSWRGGIRTGEMSLADGLVMTGVCLIALGMLMGALWAKQAWGHYWSWDPKETWAAATWMTYLVYIHYRRVPGAKDTTALWIIIVGFVFLQMCWWGINYLPAAQMNSIHVYGL